MDYPTENQGSNLTNAKNLYKNGKYLELKTYLEQVLTLITSNPQKSDTEEAKYYKKYCLYYLDTLRLLNLHNTLTGIYTFPYVKNNITISLESIYPKVPFDILDDFDLKKKILEAYSIIDSGSLLSRAKELIAEVHQFYIYKRCPTKKNERKDDLPFDKIELQSFFLDGLYYIKNGDSANLVNVDKMVESFIEDYTENKNSYPQGKYLDDFLNIIYLKMLIFKVMNTMYRADRAFSHFVKIFNISEDFLHIEQKAFFNHIKALSLFDNDEIKIKYLLKSLEYYEKTEFERNIYLAKYLYAETDAKMNPDITSNDKLLKKLSDKVKALTLQSTVNPHYIKLVFMERPSTILN